MPFRIKNIHEYDRFIAIDLGSYRVRASLYMLHDGYLVHKKSVSIRQPRKNCVDGSITDMQGVARILEKVIHHVSRDEEEIPQDIIIAFTPSLALHDISTTQYMREDHSSPLSMKEIDTMISKTEKSSFVRVRENSRIQYGIVHDDIRLISSTLTRIIIDGKDVINPIGYTGEQVRITTLNVFTLAREYNIIRSIGASLHKNIIALVPMPLIFPKILDGSQFISDHSVYIDIGYMHTTFVFEEYDQIDSFDTFVYGSKMLMDMLVSGFPKLSYTEIENLMLRSKLSLGEKEIRDSLFREYFSYVIDTFLSLLLGEKSKIILGDIILSGGIFETQWIRELFFELLREVTRHDGKQTSLMEMTQKNDSTESEFLITEGLALIAQELLFTKKDPLIRILKYVLYDYE